MITVFAEISLSEHCCVDMQRFEEWAQAKPEIVECHLISGGFDYLLKCLVKNLAHYDALMIDLRAHGQPLAKFVSDVVARSPIVRGGASLSQ